LIALLFVGGWVFLFLSRDFDSAITRPLFQLYLLSIGGAYFVYCWIHGGQTLPMKTWHIRIVTRENDKISLRTGIARYLFALFGLGLFGLGWLWALFDREKQFLHDRLAGTKLVCDTEGKTYKHLNGRG
jgi:uncharacterized RDD family membrane protein YckC